MKTHNLLILIASAGLLGSCAATVPSELVNAREAYRRAGSGAAAELAPAELHVANDALGRAELSFKEEPYSYRTRDLAYVAQRRCELAEATASIVIAKKNQATAKDDYQAAQSTIADKTKQSLQQTRAALVSSQHAGEMTAERAAEEREARVAAEQRAAEAQAELAKLAAVKEERRGTVITLSGSVLFASAQATLLPAARSRLGQIADVLLKDGERNLTVEGHTDSQGSDSYNDQLSQRRADAVRSYLEERGYDGSRITAHGMGEGHPVGDNQSAEGRANNRRVEIVIDSAKTASR
jgi:outer membrane protein OmpA-like peptidoglycan-associated protein